VVSLSIQSLVSTNFKAFSSVGQSGSDTGKSSENDRTGGLADQIQLSAKAREKLAELTETSKELSALSQRVRDSAESHEAASRAAKRDRIKQQIEQLKMQLMLASASDAKALVKKLKALASELKQLAGDVASAGGTTIPIGTASGADSQETGAQLVQALEGAEAVSLAASSADLPVELPQSGEVATALQTPADEDGASVPANAPQSAARDDKRAEREKLADAYRQIYDERQNVAAKGNSRKDELADIKELARDLKLLAGQIERKLRDEDEEDRDLKIAKRDIQETLKTEIEPSGASVEAAAGFVSSGSSNGTPVEPGAAISNPGLANVGVPIAQVQSYINVQTSVSGV